MFASSALDHSHAPTPYDGFGWTALPGPTSDAPNSAPVMAETTCSGLASRTSKAATRRPKRRTMMRSATSKTSAKLWLITTTPRAALAQSPDQILDLPGLLDS